MAVAESFDASEPKQVQARNRDIRFAERRKAEIIGAIMDLPQGREYFYELLEFCKIGHSPFAANALIMAHSCGEMNVGLKIQGDLMGAVPEKYLLMLREGRERLEALNKKQPESVKDGVEDNA
jgi:hypothetical protein